MAKIKFAVSIFFILLISMSSGASEKKLNAPEYIPVAAEPCHIECSFSFPYCYSFKTSNPENSIKITEWIYENGQVKGRAAAILNSRLIVKLCYQLSLTSAYAVADEKLIVEAEFDFTAKIDTAPQKDKSTIRLKYGGSSVTFTSFKLNGDLSKHPIPVMKDVLIEEIKYYLGYSVYETVYNSLNNTHTSEKIKNIFSDISQDDLLLPDNPCPCE